MTSCGVAGKKNDPKTEKDTVIHIYHKVGPYLLINGVITPINGLVNR